LQQITLCDTHNTPERHTYMLSAGFEPAIPERGRPQTHVLERAVSGIGNKIYLLRHTLRRFNWKQLGFKMQKKQIHMHIVKNMLNSSSKFTIFAIDK
jgi:hypothetical protein